MTFVRGSKDSTRTGTERCPRSVATIGGLWRAALYLLGSGAAVLIALSLGNTAASASPTTTGYTLCAAGSGAVSFTTSTACPTGSTKLVVGEQSDVVKLNSEVTTLQTQVTTLQTQVTTLQHLLTGVTRAPVNGTQTLQFSGENVQVVNGSGIESTDNGLGNLIVGYNGAPGKQTGSHNLLLGNGQSFTSYGGIVAGHGNKTSAPFASVVGGEYNVANDLGSAVNGGCDNLTGSGTVPTGPCPSTGDEAVGGGLSNAATGIATAIDGGQSNHASGPVAAVSGGLNNAADGLESWIGGGYANTSGNNESAIVGGGENTATGEVSTVTGGYYNTATNDEGVVVGGCSNVSGAGNVSIVPGCTQFGNSFTAILGGIGNQAVSLGATVAGGQANVANGGQSLAIAGGFGENLLSPSNYLSRIGNTGFNP